MRESFDLVVADLRRMAESYQPPARMAEPAKDPLQLTEAEIRKWRIFIPSPKRPPLVTDGHIRKWMSDSGLTRGDLYDRIAIFLARGFHRLELKFEFCDAMVNIIHGIISSADEHRPALFWDVFLAFDSGESYRDNDRTRNPVEEFTRPHIARIFERNASAFPDAS